MSTSTIKSSLPSNERADLLRYLYNKHVVAAGGWKNRCGAVVPADMADLVAEAMNFMGSIVDVRRPCEPCEGVYPDFVVGLAEGQSVSIPQGEGRVLLFSRGYYHHIGA